MTEIEVVNFILQRLLKKPEQDIVYDKDAMKVQSYFNVLSKVGLIFPYYMKNFASISEIKKEIE